MRISHLFMLFGFVRHYALKINVIKSLYYTFRLKGCCVIGNSTIHLGLGGGVIFETPESVLIIGVSGTTSVPSQLLLDGQLSVNGHVELYKGTKIVVKEGSVLSISSGTYVNEYSRIFCAKRIVIGSSCAIAWNVNIMDTDMHKIYVENNAINTDTEIHIGNNVWVGANSFISKGSNIPDNIVIGANTVTSKDMKSGFIHVGMPSKPIKQFDKWK